ncbi:hypothetical protein CDAR_27991 [Caerostris darwini]|uniref:Uncharacterized protein n=1 Tax=Caerostris darwini TaxID=1538125 RepID=A0AAV4QQ41_9ARAC|nr:hypothetical protein CDAR_27991 [Caerostris darwini]
MGAGPPSPLLGPAKKSVESPEEPNSSGDENNASHGQTLSVSPAPVKRLLGFTTKTINSPTKIAHRDMESHTAS